MEKTVGNYTYNEETGEIGRGAFSKVYLGTHVHNAKTKAAIKVLEFKQSDAKTKHLLREVELMRHLRHENVMRLIDVHYERFGKGASFDGPLVTGGSGGIRLFLIMEYCSRGDLTRLPKPLPEEECRPLFRQIFSGLRYLRSQQICHRDLKAANILLAADGSVRIADFTFSTIIKENEMMETMCGTPLTLAPEILLGEPYSDKCDLYSCGVMLYTFLYGAHPLGNVKTYTELVAKVKASKGTSFPAKLVVEKYERQTDGKPSVLVRTIHVFSLECIALAKGLLKHDQKERISWEQVYADPWLQLEPLLSPPPPFVRQGSSGTSDAQEETGESVANGEKTQSYSAPAAVLSVVPRSVSAPPRPTIKRGNTISSTVVQIPPTRRGPPSKPLPIFPGTAPPLGTGERGPGTGAMGFSETPSPANSGLAFQMSGDRPETGASQGGQQQQSRLILDYYGTEGTSDGKEGPGEGSLRQQLEMERRVIAKSAASPSSGPLPSLAKSPSPAPKAKTAATTPRQAGDSFLSRSIDALQKVFTL